MKLRVEGSFDAATALPGHERCAALHGHTYKVEMVVQGQGSKGILIDFADLKALLRKSLEKYDHRDLSQVFEYPSCEAICLSLARELAAQLPSFESLRVWEGEGKWVEVDKQELAPVLG